MPPPNRMREAFKEPYNLIGMASAAALSFATLSPVPMIAGAIVETAYLLFAPDSGWYRAKLRQREQAAEENRRIERRERTLPLLRAEEQRRYERMEALYQQIEETARENPDWFGEILKKLRDLLDRFLLFASRERQFRDSLEALRREIDAPPMVPPVKRRENNNDRRFKKLEIGERQGKDAAESDDIEWRDPDLEYIEDTIRRAVTFYEAEIRNLELRGKVATDETTANIVAKRKEVLERRIEYFKKSGATFLNLRLQLQLFEDTFGLIHDQIRARPPAEILTDIEMLAVETESTMQTLETLAPLETMLAQVNAN